MASNLWLLWQQGKWLLGKRKQSWFYGVSIVQCLKLILSVYKKDRVDDINVYTYIDRGATSVVPTTRLALLALLLQCCFANGDYLTVVIDILPSMKPKELHLVHKWYWFTYPGYPNTLLMCSNIIWTLIADVLTLKSSHWNQDYNCV